MLGRRLNWRDGRSGEHREDTTGSTRTQIRALELAWQALRGQENRRDLGSETNTAALEESSKIQKAKPEEQRLEQLHG